MTTPFQYYSEADLGNLEISTPEIIDAIDNAIRGREEGTVWSTPKSAFSPPDGRYMMSTFAAMSDPSLVVTKSVVLNPRNPDRGLPQINALISVLDGETGLPLAIMDGNWITAMRTAGVSALAARHLAREDSSVMAFVGAGVQARSHLDLFCDMYPIKHIQTFSRGRANQESLCERAIEKGLTTEICETAQQALTDADIVVSSITATTDAPPFLDAGWLKPGAFATLTDLAVSWIPNALHELDRVVIDDLEQENAMPNKLVPPKIVGGDLADLVTGRITGRTTETERLAFAFRGVPLGDLALSALAYEKAR
jgi:ornithine cyclodeaminase/alanine dehydrogenase-like protein (mu-crystallin family)